MSVIRTDTDQVSASIQLDGTGVDVHTSCPDGSSQRRHPGCGNKCDQCQSRQWQRSPLWFRCPLLPATAVKLIPQRNKPAKTTR